MRMRRAGGNLLRSGEAESRIANRVLHLPRRPSSCAFVPALMRLMPINGATTFTGILIWVPPETRYLAHPLPVLSGIVALLHPPLTSV